MKKARNWKVIALLDEHAPSRFGDIEEDVVIVFAEA